MVIALRLNYICCHDLSKDFSHFVLMKGYLHRVSEIRVKSLPTRMLVIKFPIYIILGLFAVE